MTDLGERLLKEIRKHLIRFAFNLWRKVMKSYPIITCCTTSGWVNEGEPTEMPVKIPESTALRKMIEKFGEYRNQISEEKDKKEFDDFLEFLRKSSTEQAK